jgi:hypothetical protein
MGWFTAKGRGAAIQTSFGPERFIKGEFQPWDVHGRRTQL